LRASIYGRRRTISATDSEGNVNAVVGSTDRPIRVSVTKKARNQ